MDSSWNNYSWKQLKQKFNKDIQWTLIHGEFSVQNMMIDSEERKCEVTVIDWESVSFGSGPIDLAYFILSCGNCKLRKQCEMVLLDEYYATILLLGVRESAYTRE